MKEASEVISFKDGFELAKKYLGIEIVGLEEVKGIGLEVKLLKDYENSRNQILKSISSFSGDCYSFIDVRATQEAIKTVYSKILKVDFKINKEIFISRGLFQFDFGIAIPGKYSINARLRTDPIFKNNSYSGSCTDFVQMEF